MKKLLMRLDKWLRIYRPRYYRHLLPGGTESDLNAFEDSIGFGLPQSFKELYQWRNGESPDCSDAFQYNKTFQCLEGIAASRATMSGLLEGGFFGRENESWWNRRWVPFLQQVDNEGDYRCLDMDGSYGGKPGQVLDFSHDSVDRVIEAPSLEKWLESFVVTLETGMWEENEYGFQPKDDGQVVALVKQLNPGYPIYCKAVTGRSWS